MTTCIWWSQALYLHWQAWVICKMIYRLAGRSSFITWLREWLMIRWVHRWPQNFERMNWVKVSQVPIVMMYPTEICWAEFWNNMEIFLVSNPILVYCVFRVVFVEEVLVWKTSSSSDWFVWNNRVHLPRRGLFNLNLATNKTRYDIVQLQNGSKLCDVEIVFVCNTLRPSCHKCNPRNKELSFVHHKLIHTSLFWETLFSFSYLIA